MTWFSTGVRHQIKHHWHQQQTWFVERNVMSKLQPHKMIRGNIWQRADPGPPWHPRVQEHGCKGSQRDFDGSESGLLGPRESWPQRPGKLISGSPPLHTHTSPNTTSIFGPICFPVPHSSPQHSQTHTTRSLNPIVNIISFSDRWEGSDLMENEPTNLHPYNTVIHTQLQTCMCKLALSCTMLPRMTLTVTHLLNWYVKGEGDRKSVCQK